jgi:hypothetical protein
MRHIPDYLSEDLARVLSKRIKSYWAARGGMVEIAIEPIMISRHKGAEKEQAFAIRSDMIDGQPRTMSKSVKRIPDAVAG